MRAQILLAAALSSAAIATGFLACREPPPRVTFAIASASERVLPVISAVPSASAIAAPPPIAPPTDAGPSEEALKQLMACPSPSAQILNYPDGGVVFNNAMTSADAGFLDRTQGVLDAIAAKGQALRCCFEPWLAEAPHAEGRVLLVVALAPDGAVTSAEIQSARSDIENATTRACLVAVARAADYPPSPSHVATTVEYPIRVGPASP